MGRYSSSVFVFAALAVSLSSQKSPYKAAVVDYAVKFPTSNNEEQISSNVENYIYFMKKASQQNVDILVFPESTLNNAFSSDRQKVIQHAFSLPDPKEVITPCDDEHYGEILRKLSCETRSAKLYSVINVSEKKLCSSELDESDCSPDGYNLYNTNVVFDRSGTIVSRYRKTNLFGETNFNKTTLAEAETFTTDFNVTFGHLICFDLMFNNPSAVLLEEKKVKNFLIPMMWYSELPFLTAVQFQESWTYSNNANLLVAGANSPRTGSGGSGIYSGKLGARTAVINGNTESTLLIADLDGDVANDDSAGTEPQIDTVNSHNLKLLRDNLDEYTWEKIDTAPGNENSLNICHGEFCCSISTKTTKKEGHLAGESYTYMAVAYDGVRTYSGLAYGGVQSCGIIACVGDHISSCGKTFNRSTTVKDIVEFENIHIAGEFRNINSTQFPVSIRYNLLPLRPSEYEYKATVENNIENKSIELKTTKKISNFLTFAIFGRDFTKDKLPVSISDEISMLNATNKLTTFSLRLENHDSDRSKSELNRNNAEKETEDEESGYFQYFFNRLQILLFIGAIYFLEML